MQTFKSIEKTNYPITLIGTPELFLKISYYNEYFDDLFMKQLIQKIESIIDTIIYLIEIKKNKKINEIIELSIKKEEKQQLLIEWNDTEWYWWLSNKKPNLKIKIKIKIKN